MTELHLGRTQKFNKNLLSKSDRLIYESIVDAVKNKNDTVNIDRDILMSRRMKEFPEIFEAVILDYPQFSWMGNTIWRHSGENPCLRYETTRYREISDFLNDSMKVYVRNFYDS